MEGVDDSAVAAPFDPFRVLQLHPRAPRELIAEAYWCLVEQIRRATDDATFPEAVSHLNEAYELLAGDERRRAHLESRTDVTVDAPGAPRLRQKRRFLALVEPDDESPVPTDYFALLTVDRDASDAIIELAATFHIARACGATDAHAERREAARAAEAVLLDPDQRAAHAASLKTNGHVIPTPRPHQPEPVATEKPPAVIERPQPEQKRSKPKSSRDAAAPKKQARQPRERDEAPAVTGAARSASQPSSPDRGPGDAVVPPAQPLPPARERALARVASKTLHSVRGKGAALISAARSLRRHEEPVSEEELSAAYARLMGLRSDDRQADAAPPPSARAAATSPATTAWLTFTAGPRAGHVVPLAGHGVTLGSDPACDVVLAADPPADGDSHDAARTVALEHAWLWQQAGRYMLRQIGHAVTLVGDEPLALPIVVLDDGDEIAIGPHRLRFTLASNRAGANTA